MASVESRRPNGSGALAHSTPVQSVTQEIAGNLPGILRKDLAGGGRRTEVADREETGERSGSPLAWLVFPCRSAASRAALNSGYLIWPRV